VGRNVKRVKDFPMREVGFLGGEPPEGWKPHERFRHETGPGGYGEEQAVKRVREP
jgi:hypothetical protein